jgi:thiol-disulfide isomerase/thioredoxin
VCREELPLLNKLQAEMRGKGFEILTVNLGDKPETIAKFWKENHLSLRAALNGDRVAELYKIQGFPTNYLIGNDGKVRGQIEGYDPDAIRQTLARAGIK